MLAVFLLMQAVGLLLIVLGRWEKRRRSAKNDA